MTDAGWKPRLQKIIPSYGRKINESAATTNEIRRMTSAALHLPYLDVPADLSPVRHATGGAGRRDAGRSAQPEQGNAGTLRPTPRRPAWPR